MGDRHRLSADERIVLFRGVHATAISSARAGKLSTPAPGAILLVDLYNVAFTIVHRLIGKPCFLSTDGLLRDAGANYGRVPHEAELARAFGLVAKSLAAARPSRVEAFLDAPVSRSGAHAAAFRAALALEGLAQGPEAAGRPDRDLREVDAPDGGAGKPKVSVEVVASADGAISSSLALFATAPKGVEAGPVFVLSSDSVLVDRAENVFDLARQIIEDAFPNSPLADELSHLDKNP